MQTTTARRVYELALALMNETPTALYTPDETEYRARVPALLNALLPRLYPLNEAFAAEGGQRPAPPAITALDQTVPLDDALAAGVLPYGLAAELQADENETLAAYHRQCFEENLALAARGLVQAWEPCEDVYGGLERFNAFGAW